MSIPPPLPPSFRQQNQQSYPPPYPPPYPAPAPYPYGAPPPYNPAAAAALAQAAARPRYSRRTIFITTLASVVGLLIAGVLGAFAWRSYSRNQPLPYVVETPDARFATVGAVFNGPRSVVAPSREQVIARGVLDAVSSAIAKKDNAALAKLIDADRFVQELERRGAIPVQESAARSNYVTAVAPRIPPMFTTRGDSLAWTRYDILQIRQQGGAEMEVYQRGWSKGAFPVRYRWWLRRGSGGVWRVFDIEEVAFTDRLSEWYGMTATPAFNGITPPWSGKFYNVNNAWQKALEGDYVKAEQNLAIVDGITFPPLLETVRHKVRAEIRLGQQRPADALKECAAAQAIRDDVPDTLKLMTRAYTELRQFAEAADCAQQFVTKVGPDDDIEDLLGNALLQLKRKDEAIAAFRAGINADRESGLSLSGLAGALGESGINELNRTIATSPDPANRFRLAANHAINQREGTNLSVLVEAYRPVSPADAEGRLLYYDGEARLLLKDYVKGADLLKRALALAAPSSEKLYHDEMLEAYDEANLPLEGYAASPHPDVAFGRFADVLRYQDKDGKRLHQLVTAHRAASPNDLLLDYYEAVAFGKDHDHQKELASYEKGIRAAASLDPKILERYQYGRTYAAFEAGDGLRAYDDTLPVITFDTLAPRYAEKKDAKGLEKLLTVHRAKFPDDAALPTWNAVLIFLKGDYAQTVKLVRAEPEATESETSESKNERADRQQWRRRDILIRSLLRLKRVGEVTQIVNQVKAGESPDAYYLALLNAVQNRTAMAQDQISHLLENEDYDLEEFLNDPDFGPILKTAPYASWRAKQMAATQATTRPVNDEEQ